MNTKGNIGQVVYIPVTINEIKINSQGTKYVCELPKNGISQTYEENELYFLDQKEEKTEKAEKEAPKKETKPKAKTVTKKRGRPRKASVDDLMEKVSAKSKSSIPGRAIEALKEYERSEAI